jgi:hypothetical protein
LQGARQAGMHSASQGASVNASNPASTYSNVMLPHISRARAGKRPHLHVPPRTIMTRSMNAPPIRPADQ